MAERLRFSKLCFKKPLVEIFYQKSTIEKLKPNEEEIKSQKIGYNDLFLMFIFFI